MQHLAIEILSSFINRKGHGIQLASEKKTYSDHTRHSSRPNSIGLKCVQMYKEK